MDPRVPDDTSVSSVEYLNTPEAGARVDVTEPFKVADTDVTLVAAILVSAGTGTTV